jgi:hypothetical protein
MIPCPSPTNRNRSRLFLIERPGLHDTRGIAHDELPSGTSREELLRQALQKRSDQSDAAKQRRTGEDDEDNEWLAELVRFLRSKGMSNDRDVRQACDLARKARDQLNKSEFAGNLHSEVSQPTRDAVPVLAEELLGCEPLRGGRGDRRMSGDSRLDFEMAFGLEPTLAAQHPRQRTSEKALAMDAAQREGFLKRFPEAARIRNFI